jgi:hypothetical protein
MLTCARPDTVNFGYYSPLKLFDGADVRHFVVLNHDRSGDRLDALEISGHANFVEKSLGYFKQLQSIRIECEEYSRGSGKFLELENMMNGILGVDDIYVQDMECSTKGDSAYRWSVWAWGAYRGKKPERVVRPVSRSSREAINFWPSSYVR